ncbi:hypothetical protein GCM10010404_10770 [Nonomuraea africana]|uniref:Uncharacterized protein n=1 Tax=Nonomuraea africana TaxID=46171 RepID=A0ABR9K8N1_9ACTN|nr:hypothetical protein [Nonomuraea africana]MBE1558363.1 hypothetical protein [Nonomuraea africana]
MDEGGSLARSRRGSRRGRRRKRSRGPWLLKGSVAGAALVVAGLAAGGGMLARERSAQGTTPLPFAADATGAAERGRAPGAAGGAGPAVQDGAIRDGAVRDGAVRDGAAKDGAAKDGAGANRAVATQAGAPVSASPAPEPPPPAPASVKDAKETSGHTDEKAAAYFEKRWGNDKAAKRLKDIRTVGGYLRIYTDLPESADNSAQAITLCRRGLEYLREMGEERPVVFVQAEFGENGNPVLANVLGPDDGDCRVTHPEPD